ncbi:MAG: hypothetical protein RL208_451 [Pseudomonadota bacterium]
MVFYLIQYLSDLFASSSYVVAKKFYKNGFYSTIEIFAYCNIYIVTLILCLNPILKKKYNFNLLSIKNYINNKNVIWATFLSVSTSYFKTILLSNLFNISQLTLRSYSIMCPFITLALCHFLLHDQKLNRSIIISFLMCFAGFLMFNSKAEFAFGFSFILIIYVFVNGYADYKLKSVSNKRGLEMMLFDNIMFLFISSIVFTMAMFNESFTMSVFGVQRFNIEKLININNIFPLFAIATLSFFAHNFKMLSYKAKHIAGIVILGIFFKTFNSAMMTYIEYKTLPTTVQFIAILTMCCGLSIFAYRQKTSNKKK